MNHDTYDKDILKQLRRIADSLEKIEKKLPNMWLVDQKDTYVISETVKGENNEQNNQD